MKIFYSQSTGGFYRDDVNDTMPEDVQEIPAETHRLLLEAQSQGKQIVVDGSGLPIAITPAPSVPLSVTPLEYIERFTESEQLAVVTAAMSNAELRLWYDKLMAAQEVVFTDPRLAGGLDALVAAGLITSDRKAELLTP